MGQQQHCNKQSCDNPGTDLDLLEIAAEDTDDDIRDEAKGDAIGDIISKGHQRQGQKCGNGDLQILPVDVLNRGQHQTAHPTGTFSDLRSVFMPGSIVVSSKSVTLKRVRSES